MVCWFRIRCGNAKKYKIMKRILFSILGCVFLASCQHDVVHEVDYKVILDAENTYYEGEPVRFNISGEVDNLIFYSGETGRQYKYRNRFEVPMDQVKTATLHLDIHGRNGKIVKDHPALEVWLSKDFAGLVGTDAEKDRSTIKTMVEGNMAGWERITVNEVEKVTVPHDISLHEYLENMCLALHWCPPTNTEVQRTYQINGYVSLEMEGTEPLRMEILDLGFTSVMMDKNFDDDPYAVNLKDPSNKNLNGCVRFDLAAAPIVFQGIARYDAETKAGLPYALDGWLISTPAPLNKVSNDKAIVVKNLQNYSGSFEYTFNEPGTYTVTFVGINGNYAGSSEMVKEYTITIIPKP